MGISTDVAGRGSGIPYENPWGRSGGVSPYENPPPVARRGSGGRIGSQVLYGGPPAAASRELLAS